MNSGAPASTAPPDFSSLGIMVSHKKMSAAYCAAVKYFGVYAPAGAAAFSLRTIWCTYSAASAGMICSTEPAAAPKASVRRMSRRDMDSFMSAPHGKRKDLTQRAQRALRRGENGQGRWLNPLPLWIDRSCREGAQHA